MSKINLQKLVDQATQEVDETVRKHGLDLAFRCKIKELSGNTVAVYRGGTVVRGGIAIIWISNDFVDFVKESESEVNQARVLEHLRETIAHELVHSYQDLVALYKRLNGEFIMPYFDEDEAEFIGREIAWGVVDENRELLKNVKIAINSLCE